MIRNILVAVTLCALADLFVQALRSHSDSFSRWAAIYAVSQFFFMFISWRSAAAWGWTSLQYAKVFYGSIAAVAVIAVVLSIKFLDDFPNGGTALAVSIAAVTFIAVVCGSFVMAIRQANMLSAFSAAHILVAGILLLCGVLTFVSLAFPADIGTDILKIFLGSYWNLFGLFFLSEAGLYVRGRAAAVAMMSITPLIISAIVFCSLAFIFHSRQREMSRQPSYETTIAYKLSFPVAISIRKGI